MPVPDADGGRWLRRWSASSSSVRADAWCLSFGERRLPRIIATTSSCLRARSPDNPALAPKPAVREALLEVRRSEPSLGAVRRDSARCTKSVMPAMLRPRSLLAGVVCAGSSRTFADPTSRSAPSNGSTRLSESESLLPS
eukprot:565444-Rhodomonas_salina.3